MPRYSCAYSLIAVLLHCESTALLLLTASLRRFRVRIGDNATVLPTVLLNEISEIKKHAL